MKTTDNLLVAGMLANVAAISGVLCGSLYIQVVLGEYPCPLCMVQRIAMMLCAFGQVYILGRILMDGRVVWKDFAVGHSLTLLAALVGAVMSARQILLHIVPPDPGYGMVVLGLHLYTWGLLVFACEVIAVAGNLLLAPREWPALPAGFRKTIHAVLALFAVVVFAFAVATFVEEGFHWVLPDDPMQNSLFAK